MAAVEQQTTAQRTVTVACKIPMGIVLQEFAMREEREQTINGVRDVQIGRATGRSVMINGCAIQPNKVRYDLRGQSVHITAGGYALTPNVPAEIWENWLKFNGDSPMVHNRMIFAAGSAREVEAIARENEGRRSNLEPAVPTTETNPKGDPRMPARRQQVGEGRSIGALETATGTF